MEQTRISLVQAKPGKMILARLMRDSDLIEGIIETCRQGGIETAAIQIAIGSLRWAELSWAVPSTKTKRGSERRPPMRVNGPVEFLSGQGIVCLENLTKPVVHLHGVLCDPSGRTWGGHFFPGGNPVHSTMDIVLNEIEGARMSWEYDPEIDLELPVPRPK